MYPRCLSGMLLPDHRPNGPELVGESWRSCLPPSALLGICASPAFRRESPSTCWHVQLRCHLNVHASDNKAKLAYVCPTRGFECPAAVEKQHFDERHR